MASVGHEAGVALDAAPARALVHVLGHALAPVVPGLGRRGAEAARDRGAVTEPPHVPQLRGIS